MSDLTLAFYDALVGDAGITALLSTYEGDASVFTQDPVPGNAGLPYILTVGEVSHEPWDTKDSLGREISRDVRCFTAATGSSLLVEDIAERVRLLFHNSTLTFRTGAALAYLFLESSGPIVAPTDENVYGRLITVSGLLTE